MIKTMPFVLLSLFFSLSGCAKDRGLAPPPDSEQVTVTIKVPPELEAETLQVMYRSTLCTFTDISASGKRYQRDGYQRTDIQPVRQGQSDLYQAKLPIEGGGACQWRLSNVTFGVVYANPARFGENVTYGAGGGVVVIFDHNNSPRGSADIEVDGDLTITKDYYPWLSESFLGGYKKRISLAGEGHIYLKYQALQARQVYFEPVLHSDFVLYSVGPKVKKEGNYRTFTYPDGSVFADGRWHPNFLRLQSIRLAAQGKQ
ncbi:hypothetical protein [Pseudomonas gingeri]|uniref:hypothetical protein n=1 Tax=Pseudomonas gingeri TaxID=117681 RepID=UPI0015A34D44|nr:hypothetical protein [Pseudomonas gingeri]NWA01700.1 hypothetical protein [Pseudomonas gingeri]NWA12799.1 hypothetical protein [Pseudomonas gingeri]NWA57541.1 hypothetical protein [Pseudomonas gingeri]NWA93170.1 hypothetical protein [Pseudomonas gingeri]NWB03470.1 hypothetical protein [Pseudomonas gingeri]